MKFKRRQSLIDAVQFVDGKYGEATDFCPYLMPRYVYKQEKKKTTKERVLEGADFHDDPIKDGDWIVREDGKYRVMDHKAFDAEYEPA